MGSKIDMGNIARSLKPKSCIHFKKKWHLNVKTWFNQKSLKIRRRKVRLDKVRSKPFSSFISNFRPIVRGQSMKYSYRKIIGRGFTLDELNLAGIKANFAPAIGLTVDYRRRNCSQEFTNENVCHLKEYLSKLDLFPNASKMSNKNYMNKTCINNKYHKNIEK